MHASKASKEKKEIRQVINIHKNKKKVDLSKQFDDFKQRIQEFQNKNEEIINRIRDAYTVKKKAIQSTDHVPQRNTINHGPYQYQSYDQQASSCDYSKNVVFDGNMMKHSNIASNPFYNSNVQEYYDVNSHQHRYQTNPQPKMPKMPNHHNQMQRYQSNNHVYYSHNQPVDRVNTQEDIIMNHRADFQPKTSGKFGHHEKDYEEIEQKYQEQLLKIQELEELLASKEQQISKVKNVQFRLKSFSNNLKHMVEDGLQSYQQQVVFQRFTYIQKCIKKCEQRLKNTSLKLKDAIQQRKSRKNIYRSRSKRNSVSRSKRDQSSISEEAIDSTPRLSRYPQSKGKNQSQNPIKHKQFEQIAADYQNMVKARTQQIERLQKRLNQQIQNKQMTAIQLQKTKALLDQRERQLSEVRKIKKPKQQSSSQGRQYRQLKERLAKCEEEIRAKQIKERQFSETIQKLQKSKKALHDQYTQNLNKNKLIKNKAIQELQSKLREIQNYNHKLTSELRQKVSVSEKKAMQKQCQMMTICNKLKKVENECSIKQQKLKELQSLLLKQSDHGDLLDRSISIETSALSHTEMKHLQESIRKLDQEVEEQKAVIYDMQKQKYIFQQKKKEMQSTIVNLTKANSALELKIVELKREMESYNEQQQKDQARELQAKNELIEQYESEKEVLIQQKQELSTRNQELVDELKKNKENNLTTNRQLIKTISQLNFTKNQQANLQSKLLKAKEEINNYKNRLEELSSLKLQRETQLQDQNSRLRESVQNLKNHILQLQTVGNRNNYQKQDDMLLNSLHVSEISFNYQPNKVNHEEELNTLKEKIRDLELALDIKTGTQQQIQNQYRNNLQIIRLDNADKKKELQRCRQEIQSYKQEIQRIKNAQKQDESFQNYKISMYQDKIVQMEEQYNAVKESEERLNQMLHQIAETMKVREDQKEKLFKEIEDKDKVIEQYRELLEIKQQKGQSHNNTMKEFSLRISGDHSEQLADVQLSYLSNISDVFKRDDILQQKIKRGKTSREEHIKLFAKTSAYIKSLKTIIETKQKRIKLLQKQLTSMKSQENRTWSDRQKSSMGHRYEIEQDIEECNQYKDYQSVQLDTRRSKYQDLVKELINQKSLAIEENKLLNKQIEALHQEIQRAQEQENRLMGIKDLYKDQIKKLIEKNEVHTKQFQIQINKMKSELERAQSYHNLQTIKQLFVKIVAAISYLDERTTKKDEKKDEKRKQLQEYVKVMCSILEIDPNTRDSLLQSIKK